MTYFLDLFSPETYEAFARSSREVSGFRSRHRVTAGRVKPGDKFICYMTRLSRWFGVLEVVEGPYVDNTPIFYPEDDPFVVRFKVRPQVWLPVERAIPIFEPRIWERLSFTRGQTRGSPGWTGTLRGSLVQLKDADGRFLESELTSQQHDGPTYPVDEAECKKLLAHTVRRADKVVTVTVPEDLEREEHAEAAPPDQRESIKIQALIARIGATMGMSIWLPRTDRQAVLSEWRDKDHQPIDRLPLNYDDTTLRTIEQIDVLWLRGRSIVRAFEVEHTTSVYSGILRMADLLALQPNMDIKLHIVAPASKREKVFQEIRRPVFSLLEKGPLFESCTYLSYESIYDIAGFKHLSHLSDTVLDEYAEEAE